MKIREGFISNSSSTSFIVGVSDTEIELHIKADLARYGDVLTTEKEVTDYFKDYYGSELEDDVIKKWYEQALDMVRRGFKVVAGRFHDDSGAIEAFLCDNGIPETPGIEIIHSEGGC